MNAVLQLVVIVVCSVGCLASLVSVACACIASLRQVVHQGMSFLSPVSAASLDDTCVPLFFGLFQVRHLAEQLPTTPQGDEEVQA